MTAPRILAFNDLESVYDSPNQIGRLAGLIRKLRDANSVVCGAGDNTALGTVPLLTGEGRTLARPFFEAIQPHVETFGNHDFDLGRAEAFDWAESVPTTYCCANLTGPDTESIPATTICEIDDHRLGFVGVAHPETANICGSISELTFHDPIEAVNESRRHLQQQGADDIVVLAHCGGLDVEIATQTDVDLVVGGHVHERECERVNGTIFVRTGGGGTELAEVRLDTSPTVEMHDISDAPRDPHVTDRYQAYRAKTDADQVVAEVTDSIQRTTTHRFGGESRAGNFLADAIRHEAETDFAIFPAGSLRTGSSLSGAITVGEMVSLAPFADPVREVVLHGRELRHALDGAAVPHQGNRGWVHAHLSGGQAIWDGNGNLVQFSVDGDPVDDDRTYSIATTGWLVEVSDLFAPISIDNVVATHDAIFEAVIHHAKTGALETVTREGRIQKLD